MAPTVPLIDTCAHQLRTHRAIQKPKALRSAGPPGESNTR